MIEIILSSEWYAFQLPYAIHHLINSKFKNRNVVNVQKYNYVYIDAYKVCDKYKVFSKQFYTNFIYHFKNKKRA